MANPVQMTTFLAKAKTIYNEHPTYRQPGDGSDGTCDCIGLIIGAIRRSGGSWTGIHGSNYAARWEIIGAQDISTVNDVYVGMAVFKFKDEARNQDLPSRYKQRGSKYYNGDLRDYYHVGVVISINPLKIMHMTSPTVKIDTKLGNWRYGGRLKKVTGYEGSSVTDKQENDGGAKIMVEKYKMEVKVNSGTTLNLRKDANTNSEILTRIPNGTVISIYDDSSDMYQTQYKNIVGYVSKKFLVSVNDTSDKKVGIYIPIPANMISEVLDALKKSEIVE